MQMDAQQFKQLLEALHSGEGFNGIQGMISLGATLVSVTAVVIGMKSALATLAEQLKDTREDIKSLAQEVQKMAQQIAVLQYAFGSQADVVAVKEK